MSGPSRLTRGPPGLRTQVVEDVLMHPDLHADGAGLVIRVDPLLTTLSRMGFPPTLVPSYRTPLDV
ncbi:MAG: hypothetical protein ACRCSN_18685 [Dermatophilaceae bacterium]